jgi:probable addiction module antidote protein
MAKTKTSKRRKNLPRNSMVINGITVFPHDPSAIFKNHKVIKNALTEALFDGDKEAFVEILEGYVRVHNILEVCRRTGLSRTVVYEAIGENGNPSLDTVCKILKAFDKAS